MPLANELVISYIEKIASRGTSITDHSLARIMESLFSPCARFRDIFGIDFLISPEELQERTMDISIEELFSAERAFTYADLYAMLASKNAVLWLTPHAAVLPTGGKGLDYCGRLNDAPIHFHFRVDGKEISAVARSPEHLLEICDVLFRLLAASVVHSVFFCTWKNRFRAPINVTTLAYLMEQCQSLKMLALSDVALDENHCRVLGTYSRPDLEIDLIRCC
jgi:hypothetical protein